MIVRSARSLVAAFAIAASIGCAAQSPQQPAATAQWTQFRLNGRHDATLPGTLRVSWRLETHGAFSSSPAIADATVYIGNNAGLLYAIDVRTGRPRWIYRATAPLMSNPLVWHGLVIAGEGNEVPWTADEKHPRVVGSTTNALVALDARSGRVRWSVPLAGSGMPTPAIVGGLLIHHNGGALLAAIDPDTGKVFYSVDLVSVASMSSILPLDGLRFATTGGAEGVTDVVTARNARDGSALWTAAFPRTHWGFGDCPAAGDGTRVFCNYVGPGNGVPEKYRTGVIGVQHAYAVDANDGTVVWDRALESGIVPQRNLAAIPLVRGRTLYFGGSIAPYVHALSVERGDVLWRARVRGSVKGGIAAKDGILYFGDHAGYLWALDARTGTAIGSKRMPTSFNVGSPVIDGNTLVIGSNSGTVIAIPLDVIRNSHDR